MKDSFEKYFSTRRERSVTGSNVWKIDKKNGFHLPENPIPLTVMEYSFKNMFPLNKKTKESVGEESENGYIFQKLDFPYGFH